MCPSYPAPGSKGFCRTRLGPDSGSYVTDPSQTLRVTANAAGAAGFWLQSTAQLSAGRVECVRLEVRDPITNEISTLQTGAIFETVCTCMFDAIAGFTGLGDTSGSYTGVVASLIGGALSVNDAGALIKNGARAAGITDHQCGHPENHRRYRRHHRQGQGHAVIGRHRYRRAESRRG